MTTDNWTSEKVVLICVDCGKPNGFYVSEGMNRAIRRRGILPRCTDCVQKAIKIKRGKTE